MICNKCNNEMSTTPVCITCGTIPITEASIKALNDKLQKYENALIQMSKFSKADFCKPSPAWFIELAKRTLESS